MGLDLNKKRERKLYKSHGEEKRFEQFDICGTYSMQFMERRGMLTYFESSGISESQIHGSDMAMKNNAILKGTRNKLQTKRKQDICKFFLQMSYIEKHC